MRQTLRRPLVRFRPTLAHLEPRQLLSADVLTYHDDLARTSSNLAETILTPSVVNAASFGKVGFLAVDGKVDAQPLVKTGVNIPGQGVHDVVYVATEADSLYAFDAGTGALLWHDGPSGGANPILPAGETTVPATDFNCDQVAPTIGITSTPVIDPATNTIYVVAMSKSVVDGTSTYFQRIHAIDLATGLDRVAPRSIDSSITYPGRGPGGDGTNVIFDPKMYDDRAALTLSNGVVYTAWASHCDLPPYTGWVIGFRAGDLGLASVLNINPNGTPAANNTIGESGNSFWNSGAGFAADASGNLYGISANGPFDPSAGDYGDAYLKFSTANGGLGVADYFAPFNQQALSDADIDLGSSGLLLLPDLVDASGRTVHLAVGSGKDGNIYVVDRDNLGHKGATSNPIVQELDGQLGGAEFGSPAYFNGTVYFGGVGAPLKAFTITNGRLSATATSRTSTSFVYPGTSPTVSANGTTGGIVWAAENGPVAGLHAYDASDLGRELYNSNQASGGRDQFGAGNKFITPTVANGRVFVGTTNGVAVFGLLGPIDTTPPPPGPSVAVAAFSSASPTVGKLNLLGVVGAEAGLAESQLTYTWTTRATPFGAPAPTFSGGGTNSSKLVAFSVAQPGGYVFRVTIADPNGDAVSNDVTVEVAAGPSVAVAAFTSPTPVVAGFTQLGVVGADPAGESSLVYSWSTIAAPAGAPSPVFGGGGTNSAKLSAVAIATPGTYTFRATILDPAGGTTTSDVTVEVGVPVPSIVVPAFASASPRVGTTALLGALAADPAFPEAALTYTWTLLGSPSGALAPTIGPNGSRLLAVTFARAGLYAFRVRVTNPFGLETSSDLAVNVAPGV